MAVVFYWIFGLFLVVAVTGLDMCPAKQEPMGKCSDQPGENCTEGFVCFNGTCCPNCQTRWEQLNSTKRAIGTFMPQCDHSGDYLSEQCHYSAGLCWCVTRFGEEIPKTQANVSVTARIRGCDQERVRFNQSDTENQTNPSSMTANSTTENLNRSTTESSTKSAIENSKQSTTESSKSTTEHSHVSTSTKINDFNETMTTTEMKNLNLTDLNETTTPSGVASKAMKQVQERPGTCPGVKPGQPSGPCLILCVHDSDCPLAGFKCCDNGCGKECKPPAMYGYGRTSGSSVLGKEKPGRCTRPTPSTTLPPGSTGTCDSDRECGGSEKCCANAAGQMYCTSELANDSSTNPANLSTSSGFNISGNSSSIPWKQCNDSNALWNPCASTCQGTCLSKPTICTDQCIPGCVCKSDFVKESNDANSKCVPRDQCQVGITAMAPTDHCQDPNSAWSNCGNACEENCQGIPWDICRTMPCIAGCFCKAGYVKAMNDPGARCISKNECNVAVIQPGVIQQQQCPDPNSIFLSCGTACEETCTYKPTVCTKQCMRGCFCKPGFVKASDNTDANCVGRDRCFQQPIPQQQCQDPNAVFQTCGSGCPETCDFKPTLCYVPCVAGCFCKEGYVKENGLPNAQCVPKSQCGQLLPPGAQRPRCTDPNSTWSNCGTACPATCQQPNPQMCTLQCVAGCFCNNGYVKESPDPNAKCLPQSTCAQQTPGCPDPNSTWQNCGTACQETCQFRPTFCTMQCMPGCFCKEGFVKEMNSPQATCVPRNSCPATQQPYTNIQTPRIKPGTCPPFTPNPYFGRPQRQDQCQMDNDCQTNMKCCNTMTGFVCLVPSGSEDNQQCGNNQEYSPCPPTPNCVLTCDNYNRPPAMCTTMACGFPGCQCRAGYVLNTRRGRRECVQPYMCFLSSLTGNR